MNREHLAKRNEERYDNELSTAHDVLAKITKEAIIIGGKGNHTYLSISPYKDFYVFCYLSKKSGKVKTFLPVTEGRLRIARAYFDKEYERRRSQFSEKKLASKIARLDEEFGKYRSRLERTERFL